MCSSILRVDAERLGVVGDSALGITLCVPGDAPVVERVGVLGADAERLGVVGDSALGITLGVPGDAPVVERFGVLGVDAERLGVVGDLSVGIVACTGFAAQPGWNRWKRSAARGRTGHPAEAEGLGEAAKAE